MAQITWLEFSNRPDIKGLPLHEQKKRFLRENDLRAQKDLYALHLMYGGAAGIGFGGAAVDGPIAGATVTSNAGVAVTDANGNFTLPGTPSGPITVTGGTDAITGVAFEGELVGYPEYKTISPITTFAHYLKQASEESEDVATLTIDEAVTKTFVSSSDYFGIDLPLDEKELILQKDFIRESIEKGNKVGIAAQAVSTQIEAIAETIGASLEGTTTFLDSKEFNAIPELSQKRRKQSVYGAMGRQIINSGAFNVEKVQDEIKFTTEGKFGEREERVGLSFNTTGRKNINSQLSSTISSLVDLAKQPQYTTNYLTTQIQAINRAQKTTIKGEAVRAVKNEIIFSNIDDVKDTAAGDLKQIESGKENTTEAELDGVANVITGPRFYQTRIQTSKLGDTKVKTELEFESLPFQLNYFGEAVGATIQYSQLAGPRGDVTYLTFTAPITRDETALSAIILDREVLIEVEADLKRGTPAATYTCRPFVFNKSLDFGTQLGLRIARVETAKQDDNSGGDNDHVRDEGVYRMWMRSTPAEGEPETRYEAGETMSRVLDKETGKNYLSLSEFFFKPTSKTMKGITLSQDTSGKEGNNLCLRIQSDMYGPTCTRFDLATVEDNFSGVAVAEVITFTNTSLSKELYDIKITWSKPE